jgi:hypothetical protein
MVMGDWWWVIGGRGEICPIHQSPGKPVLKESRITPMTIVYGAREDA